MVESIRQSSIQRDTYYNNRTTFLSTQLNSVPVKVGGSSLDLSLEIASKLASLTKFLKTKVQISRHLSGRFALKF